jgi:hypothetical protein
MALHMQWGNITLLGLFQQSRIARWDRNKSGCEAIQGPDLCMPQVLSVAGLDPPYEIDSLVPRPTTLGKIEEKVGATRIRR